jgi:hypothetical protein
MIAVVVSVVLFSVVPSNANQYLRAGISLGGAALFFFKIFPPIRDQISHPDITVSGGIYYQADAKNQTTLKPVPAIEVEIPFTDLQSFTNDVGEFAIHHAPLGVKRLDVHYKTNVISVNLSDYKDNRYPIIPPENSTVAADVLPPALAGVSAPAEEPLNRELPPSKVKLTPNEASWVYLGDTKQEDKQHDKGAAGVVWVDRYFDVSGQPQANKHLRANATVYRRSDKPVQVGPDWKLGDVEGLLKAGDSVKAETIEKIAGEEGTTHWWARVGPG